MRDDADESPRARIDALKLGAADRRAVNGNEPGDFDSEIKVEP